MVARTMGATGKDGTGVGKPLPGSAAIGSSGVAALSLGPVSGFGGVWAASGMPVSPPGSATTTLAVRKSANRGGCPVAPVVAPVASGRDRSEVVRLGGDASGERNEGMADMIGHHQQGSCRL
jgi:hypothetical protein